MLNTNSSSSISSSSRSSSALHHQYNKRTHNSRSKHQPQRHPLINTEVLVFESTIQIPSPTEMKNMQQIPASMATTPTTPTTVGTAASTTMSKQPHAYRGSMTSLEKLESSHLGILEGTIQEIQDSNRQEGNKNNHRNYTRRRTLKSPTEWSTNSSIPESGEDLNILRQELNRAESSYSRKTGNATLGERESNEDGVVAGSFLPIPTFEEYKDYDPAGPLTNHVPSPQRAMNRIPTMTNSSMPQIQSQHAGMVTPNPPSLPNPPTLPNSSSLLSFPHTMETLSEDQIIGAKPATATFTPQKITQCRVEEESAQETSPDPNAVPQEVFVLKGSSASTSGVRTVVSNATFDDTVPTTPNPNTQSHLSSVHARGWATVAEIRNTFSTPKVKRRHSSFNLGQPPTSFLKSVESPMHELVKKQERKRLHLKATIDKVRTQNLSRDREIKYQKDQLQKDLNAQRLAHKQLVNSMENKIKFLKRQHEVQIKQQDGALELTNTHNRFLKEQLDQVQQEYERLHQHHKRELSLVMKRPDALHDQIQMLEQSKKLLLARHEQELNSKQVEYASLESRFRNIQEAHAKHEKSSQERLEEESKKVKKFQVRMVEMETIELTVAQQKISFLQGQLESTRREHNGLVNQHRVDLIRGDDKYTALLRQHAQASQSNHEECTKLHQQVSDLQTTIQKLESFRVKEHEHSRILQQQLTQSRRNEQETSTLRSSLELTNEKLNNTLQSVQQERDRLLESEKEQAQLQDQMKQSFSAKVGILEQECTRLQTTLEEGITSQTSEIEKLRGKLDAAETEWHAQRATNAQLQEKVEVLEEEREDMLAIHTKELDKAVNANVTLARDLMKDLAFGL